MSERLARRMAFLAYAALGAALVASRTVGLSRSFWHDEIVAVREYVREGPHEIVFGAGLSHQLFSLLGWVLSSLVGESEIALRLLSVLPFLAGVGLVTWWLHVRAGPLPAAFFLFFATVSPLLLDITRQARGYGLGFMAMALVIVGAMEALRDPRTRYLAVLCAGGLIGTMTLPNVAIVFAATSAVLIAVPALRWKTVLGASATLVLAALWYSPHRDELRDVSQTPYGNQIGPLEAFTAPFDQILLPALTRLDGETPIRSVAWLPIVVAVAIPVATSPLLRNVRTAWILCSGIVASVLALVISGAHVVPRYVSFLLVPAFVLLATGSAAILTDLRRRPRPTRMLIVLGLVVLLLVAFPANAVDVTRLPREAHRDVARLIDTETDETTAVYVLAPQPGDLRFYLDRDVRTVTPAGAAHVCENLATVVYVQQRWRVQTVELPCLNRPGAQFESFEQYARGGRIDVWLIPPAS